MSSVPQKDNEEDEYFLPVQDTEASSSSDGRYTPLSQRQSHSDGSPRALGKEILEDITQQFVEAARQLPNAKLESWGSFSLSEAMSAIELMDPKMDSGVVRMKEQPNVEDVIAEGWMEMDLPDLIATIDATFAAAATWISGCQIAQTLLTNLLVTSPDAVSAATGILFATRTFTIPEALPIVVLEALSQAMAHFISQVRHAIETAGTYLDEDFNHSMPYDVISSIKFEEMMTKIGHAEDMTKRCYQESGENSVKKAQLAALARRLAWLHTFLTGLDCLVVPMDYNIAENDNEAFKPRFELARVALSEAAKHAESNYNDIELGTTPSHGQDGDFGWLKWFLPDLNRRYMPPTFPRKADMLTRRAGTQAMLDLTRSLQDIAEIRNADDDYDPINMLASCRTLTRLGSKSGCVLARAVMQLVFLPSDERVFGRIHLRDLLKKAIKRSTGPPVLFPGSPSNLSDHCQALFDEFLRDLVKIVLFTVQIYGHNSARQPEKLADVYQDYANIMREAENVDVECMRITEEAAKHSTPNRSSEPIGPHPEIQCLTYVQLWLSKVVFWNWELMWCNQLLVDFEYPFAYWYMKDIVVEEGRRVFERAMGYIEDDHSAAIKQARKKSKLKDDKFNNSQMCTSIKERLADYQTTMRIIYEEGLELGHLLKAYNFLTILLAMMGKIKMVEWVAHHSEKLRVEHRMAPFAALDTYFVSYEAYLRESVMCTMAMKPIDSVIKVVGSLFQVWQEWDIITDSRIRNMPQDDVYKSQTIRAKQELIRITKETAVVIKILEVRPNAKVVLEFESDVWHLYPTLKLIKS